MKSYEIRKAKKMFDNIKDFISEIDKKEKVNILIKKVIYINFIQNKIKYENEMGDYLKNILKVIFLFCAIDKKEWTSCGIYSLARGETYAISMCPPSVASWCIFSSARLTSSSIWVTCSRKISPAFVSMTFLPLFSNNVIPSSSSKAVMERLSDGCEIFSFSAA